jgi:SNF family Na+-dependent transporter
LKWKLILGLALGWFIIGTCMLRGVRFLGRLSLFTTPFPFLAMFALLIRAVTLNGAAEGLNFIWTVTDLKYIYELSVKKLGNNFAEFSAKTFITLQLNPYTL